MSCSDFWLPVSLDPALFVNTLSSGDGPVGQDHFIRVRMYYPTTQSSAPNCFSKTQWLPAPARLYAEAYVCFMSLPSWFAKFTAPILMNVYSPIGVDDPPLNYPNMGTPLSEGTGTNIDGEPASWKGWPVVLFSHGLGGSVSTYGCICAEMASNGAVVFAPEHQDGSAVTTFGLKITPEVNQNTRKLLRSEDLRLPRDMELERIPYTHWKHLESLHSDGEGPWRARQICRRKTELVAIVESVKDLRLGEGTKQPFGISDAGASLLMKDSSDAPSQLNFNKISLVGHSFGGATVLDVGLTLRTERVIALDPWAFALKTPIVSRKGSMTRSGGRSILDQGVTTPTFVLMTQSLMYTENEDDIRRLYSATARVRSASIKAGGNSKRSHFVLAEVMNTRHQDQSDVPAAIPFVAKFFCMASNQVKVLFTVLIVVLNVDIRGWSFLRIYHLFLFSFFVFLLFFPLLQQSPPHRALQRHLDAINDFVSLSGENSTCLTQCNVADQGVDNDIVYLAAVGERYEPLVERKKTPLTSN